ncbi:hypothetical protein [Castellaniella sp.]|uniref:hypothetical protein n=1 Tax=Castellaniella sp. TaxID=1955812 RepID=UPI002AFEFB53|nr:hypothetical protein [Castellaniella sp.]
MAASEGLDGQLIVLMTGLADQKIKDGSEFYYDGGALYATDVAEISLPCALVLADALSRRLGMGGSGHEFEIGPPNPVFPVCATQVQARPFLEVAPFVTEIFESVVMDVRHDLSRIYAFAARQLGLALEDDAQLTPAGRRTPLEFAPLGQLLTPSARTATADLLGG